MRCLYCETDIHTYPESGTCPNCGGKLPKPAQQQFTRPLRTCSVCGAQSRSSFCPDCGRSLTASAAATPFVPPMTAPFPGAPAALCATAGISPSKSGVFPGAGVFWVFSCSPFWVRFSVLLDIRSCASAATPAPINGPLDNQNIKDRHSAVFFFPKFRFCAQLCRGGS